MEMTLKKMISATLIGWVLIAIPQAGFAAEAVNNGTEDIVLLVTEDDSRTEVAVTAGQSATFCESGCFVTFPNGDRHALKGDEVVEFANGQALIK